MQPKNVILEPQDLNTYCPELWSRAYISQQNDQFAYKPCCYYRPSHNDSLKEFNKIFNDLNEKHKTIRINNLQGIKDPGCSYCFENEKSLDSSARTNAIKDQGTNLQLIKHLDLNLGNLCNLSCAICGPYNSSSWIPIAEQGWGKIDTIFKYKPKNRNVIDDPELFLQLKTIQLQGGEVFLEPNYQKFFENIGKYRSYDDLEIMIFTNGTVRPNVEFMNILNKCGKVRIFFSIDDIKQRFEYQRRGANWNEVLSNIDWFVQQSQADLGFNITYSLFNIYYLKELYLFLSDRYPDLNRNYSSFNSGMANCSAEFLREKEYYAVLESIKEIPELTFLNDFLKIKELSYYEFKKYVEKYDLLTHTSYANTHPEFWNLINN